jgi:hypothetical protein
LRDLRRVWWVAIACLVPFGACRAAIPNAEFACVTSSECPSGFACDERLFRCVRGPDWTQVGRPSPVAAEGDASVSVEVPPVNRPDPAAHGGGSAQPTAGSTGAPRDAGRSGAQAGSAPPAGGPSASSAGVSADSGISADGGVSAAMPDAASGAPTTSGMAGRTGSGALGPVAGMAVVHTSGVGGADTGTAGRAGAAAVDAGWYVPEIDVAYCVNVGRGCVCIPTNPGEPAYDDCLDPRPPCCFSDLMETPNCQCWPQDHTECKSAGGPDRPRVEVCPPR